MLLQLGALVHNVHNVTLWEKGWLVLSNPKLRPLGVLRPVRDVFTTSGLLVINALGEMVEILMNPSDTWARK
jgi:hypothetical protein